MSKRDENVIARSKKRAKNDNLAKYKQEVQKRNRELVERVVTHIQSLSGEINFSSVSRATYDLADPARGEKGLTVAALSKNPVYRAIIEAAREGWRPAAPEKVSADSVGDLKMRLHGLRIKNAALERENRIIRGKLASVRLPEPSAKPFDETGAKQLDETRRIASSIIERLFELEMCVIDRESGNLVLTHFGEVIAQKEVLETLGITLSGKEGH